MTRRYVKTYKPFIMLELSFSYLCVIRVLLIKFKFNEECLCYRPNRPHCQKTHVISLCRLNRGDLLKVKFQLPWQKGKHRPSGWSNFRWFGSGWHGIHSGIRNTALSWSIPSLPKTGLLFKCFTRNNISGVKQDLASQFIGRRRYQWVSK